MHDGIDLHQIALWLVVAIIAITFHEAAHGWTAMKRGDPTAQMLGRVTFNPAAHIDPFGTLILPLMMQLSGLPFMFGWAKPVPVNFRRLRTKWDIVLVAGAGPAVNLALALISALLLRLILPWAETLPLLVELLVLSLYLNLGFCVFNLLPFPPLDGYRILSAILPPDLSILLARLERFGLGLVLGVLFVLPWLAGQVGINFDPLGVMLVAPVMKLADLIMTAVGLNAVM